MDPVIGGLVGAGISGIASLFNAGSQKRENQRQRDYNTQMYEKQKQDSIDFWNMQNAYNDPQAQMQRLQDAGMNPHLAYGNGSVANTSASAPDAPKALSYHGTAPKVDPSSMIGTYYSIQQQKANIDKTNAEADAIRTSSGIQNFELEARKQIGQSAFTQQLEAKLQNATNQDIQEIRKYQEWLDLAFATSSDPTNISKDKFGTYPTMGSKFVSDQVSAITRETIMKVEDLKSSVALKNSTIGLQGQQKEINELNKILMKAEADFVKHLGSIKGAGFFLQLLQTVLGRKGI